MVLEIQKTAREVTDDKGPDQMIQTQEMDLNVVRQCCSRTPYK